MRLFCSGFQTLFVHDHCTVRNPQDYVLYFSVPTPIMSYPTLPSPPVPYSIVSYHVLSYHVRSCPVLTCPSLSSTLPYITLPWSVLHCLLLPSPPPRLPYFLSPACLQTLYQEKQKEGWRTEGEVEGGKHLSSECCEQISTLHLTTQTPTPLLSLHPLLRQHSYQQRAFIDIQKHLNHNLSLQLKFIWMNL